MVATIGTSGFILDSSGTQPNKAQNEYPSTLSYSSFIYGWDLARLGIQDSVQNLKTRYVFGKYAPYIQNFINKIVLFPNFI